MKKVSRNLATWLMIGATFALVGCATTQESQANNNSERPGKSVDTYRDGAWGIRDHDRAQPPRTLPTSTSNSNSRK